MVNYLIFVSGRVQGVGFRYATLLLARQYHLTGTVENLPDGQVKINVQGPASDVKAFVLAIKAGPNPYCRVEEVHIQPQPLAKWRTFKITN